jgi:two-component system sensor histidine kinase TctE
VTILAAETLVKRKELVRDILLGMLLPEVLLVLVAASVIWFGVRSGLRPLDTLRAELADRSQADLRPVTVSVPEEIQPVVTEVNGLLMRLDTALTSQRHFVSDAAHQLRTPIAALLAQVEAAQHEAGEGGNGTLRGIHAAAGRLGHLVEQLLALARAEPSLAQASSVVSLVAWSGRWPKTGCPQPSARKSTWVSSCTPPISGQRAAAGIAGQFARQRLAPCARGGVTVGCGQEGRAWLCVEDNGPGIPEGERERIGQRFYRPAGQTGDGCGLGLAIVREIARQYQGTLSVGTSPRWAAPC